MTRHDFFMKYDVDPNLVYQAAYRTPTQQSADYLGRNEQFPEQELVEAVAAEIDHRCEKLRKKFKRLFITKALMLKKYKETTGN